MDYLISEKLRELRKDRNITQENLAEILDISRSKVSSWETNKRDMTITDAVNLANYYEISLDNLLRVNPIKEKEYIEISYSFFKNKSISLKEKTKIIKMMEESLKCENIDELYENYKMTQNSKKNAIFVAFLICKFKIKNVRISDI